MAELVKLPTIDFGSGHDLRVVRSSLALGSAVSGHQACLASGTQ